MFIINNADPSPERGQLLSKKEMQAKLDSVTKLSSILFFQSQSLVSAPSAIMQLLWDVDTLEGLKA